MSNTAAIEAILERAKAGDAEAQNDLGRRLATSGSRTEAEQWFRRAADQGLAQAKHNLGVLYWQNDDASHEALEWFVAAAKDGWPPSNFILGAMFEKREDLDTARRLYLTAAERGHAGSQDALSRLYLDRDAEGDIERARRWAEAAAEHGVAASIARLGAIYHEGRGVSRDPPRAAAYFLEAAKLGHDGAQLMIGVAMHIGIGVVPDRIEAAHWLLRSAEQGNKYARAYLEAKAGISDLTPQELEEAQRRTRQPLPSTRSFTT